jgi:ADP-heptose:LPS heptosyltransferase
VREDGRIGGGEEWQAKIYSSEEWKKLVRMARNRGIHCLF